jgi:galactoside 2-L-fucosyltransferase 1/2
MLKAASLTGRQVAMVKNHPSKSWLDSVFNLSIARVDDIDHLCPCTDVTESRGLAYEWSLPTMMKNPTTIDGKSLLICGWTQSWKYMTGIENQLRRQLRPHSNICKAVSQYFEHIRPPSWSKEYLRVGIHIRVGNLADKPSVDRGFTIPQLPFFEKAINYIVENGTSIDTAQSGEKRRIQFIVVTDDVSWTRANLNLSSVVNERKNSAVVMNLTYSLGNTAAFDMILLSKCDVVVMTTGTYGWWAAWLANSKMTLYYSGWPRPGSYIQSIFVREDFFPPHWIPIDGPFFTF